MTAPTIVLRVDAHYYSRRSDGSVWATIILTDGVPDFTQAIPVATGTSNGSTEAVGARKALDVAERLALASGINVITYFDG